MCRGVSPTSEMRMEIQMRSGHLFWAEDRQISEAIDLQPIFDDYLSSDKREFALSSQSSLLNSPLTSI